MYGDVPRTWQLQRVCPAFLLTFLVITGGIFFLNQPEVGFQTTYHASVERSKTVTFERVPFFEDLSYDNDEEWAARVMPKRLGFIYVKHNETLQLERGISMFHAMHCLSLLRQMLQDSTGSSEVPSHMHRGASGESEQHLHMKHVPHCVSYLAQYILCAADSTIEPPWLEKDKAGNIVGHGVDGHGIQHRCKKNDHLWKLAMDSEEKPLDSWNWQPGDTVETVLDRGLA